MAGISLPTLPRKVLVAVPLLGSLLLLSGCGGDEYPEDLTFTARNDPIVVNTGSAQPKGFDRPGEFPKAVQREILDLREQGAQIIDMDMAQEKERLSKLKAEREPSKQSITELEKDIADWPKRRGDLERELTKIFGTPAHPKVALESHDEDKEVLQLDDKTLAKGSVLYRRHCLHCHGVTGDGRGPTAGWVNPHPRDYRSGSFKFVSVESRARRADLVRTLRQGIEGTSMPTFGLLGEEDLQALASTVIHLSLRGETELRTIAAIRNPSLRQAMSEDNDNSVAAETQAWAIGLIGLWKDNNDKAVKVQDYALKEGDTAAMQQSVRKGHQLFKQKGCVQCHIDYGRKDAFRYDAFGTVVRPANLTAGVYRGGRRPLDIYLRFHAGIPASQMPTVAAQLTGSDGWDLVNFLKALPYPEMLPDDLRTEIYGGK